MGAEQGTGKTAPCPACGAANETDAPRCTACGILIGRRRRRGVAAESDTPFSPAATPHNLPALRAYRIAVVSMPRIGRSLIGQSLPAITLSGPNKSTAARIDAG